MISSKDETFNYSGPSRCWRHGKTDCELCFTPPPTTKNDSTIIQCDECSNHVVTGEFTEQELIDDGWKLNGPIYCPVCGPDEGERQ